MNMKFFGAIVFCFMTHLCAWSQFTLPWGNTGTALPSTEIPAGLFSGPKVSVPCSIRFLHSNYNIGETFGAEVSVFNISVSDVILRYVDPEGYSTNLIEGEDYSSHPYKLIVWKELEPGSKLILKDNNNNTLASERIPRKGTAKFNAFIEKINRAGAAMQNSGSNSNGNTNSVYQNTRGRSKISIESDLRNAYKLLAEMERNRENVNLMTQKIQYDAMIVKQRERISRLEMELQNAQ